MRDANTGASSMNAETKQETQDTLACAAQIVAAYTAKNAISAIDVPSLLRSVYAALAGLSSGSTPDAQNLKPAVPVKKSITPDYIVCLEDGKHLTMLKRYLRSR